MSCIRYDISVLKKIGNVVCDSISPTDCPEELRLLFGASPTCSINGPLPANHASSYFDQSIAGLGSHGFAKKQKAFAASQTSPAVAPAAPVNAGASLLKNMLGIKPSSTASAASTDSPAVSMSKAEAPRSAVKTMSDRKPATRPKTEAERQREQFERERQEIAAMRLKKQADGSAEPAVPIVRYHDECDSIMLEMIAESQGTMMSPEPTHSPLDRGGGLLESESLSMALPARADRSITAAEFLKSANGVPKSSLATSLDFGSPSIALTDSLVSDNTSFGFMDKGSHDYLGETSFSRQTRGSSRLGAILGSDIMKSPPQPPLNDLPKWDSAWDMQIQGVSLESMLLNSTPIGTLSSDPASSELKLDLDDSDVMPLYFSMDPILDDEPVSNAITATPSAPASEVVSTPSYLGTKLSVNSLFAGGDRDIASSGQTDTRDGGDKGSVLDKLGLNESTENEPTISNDSQDSNSGGPTTANAPNSSPFAFHDSSAKVQKPNSAKKPVMSASSRLQLMKMQSAVKTDSSAKKAPTPQKAVGNTEPKQPPAEIAKPTQHTTAALPPRVQKIDVKSLFVK